MRGIKEYNFPAFDTQAKKLIKQGWEVVNPADLDRAEGGIDVSPYDFDPTANIDDRKFMRRTMLRDITTLCDKCDAIYMLLGWERSDGARAEHSIALAVGLTIYYENKKIHKENHE